MERWLDSLLRNSGAEEVPRASDKIVREIVEAAPIQYLSLMQRAADAHRLRLDHRGGTGPVIDQ